MAGGKKGRTIAPEIPKKGPRSRFTTAVVEWSLPRRFEYGCMLAKTIPRFGALPEKLKPVTAKVFSTSGVLCKIFCTCCSIPLVYSKDAPVGDCTAMMNQP